MRQTALQRCLLLLLCIIAVVAWALRLRQPDPVDVIKALMAQEQIRGAVVAIRTTDGTIHTHAFGESTQGTHQRMTVSATFPVASLSKPITAAAVRHLIKQGVINLDDAVFPSFLDLAHAEDPRYSAITVKNLLQHTSGLWQAQGDPMFRDGTPVGCDEAILSTLQHPLDHAPGEQMRYSNTGYCLLGRVIEHVTGQNYASAVQSIINFPTGKLSLGPAPESPHEGNVLPANIWTGVGAAGGWFGDAASLIQLLALDAQDLSIPTAAMLPYDDWYYGLGWRVWPEEHSYRLTHFGALPGMFSVVIAFPDGRAAVILFNGRPANDQRFATQVYGVLSQAIHAQEQRIDPTG